MVQRAEQQIPGLPRSPTTFVGRERELSTLIRLLEHPASGARLVTLTGAPGAGKTRLAMEAATLLAARGPFEDIGFVDLSAAAPNDIEHVLGIVAAASRVLRGERVLLILDNFETVLVAATDLAKAIERTPNMWTLVTSLRPLGIYGEHHMVVPPLEAPPVSSITVAAVSGYTTVQLFVDRARAAVPDFALTDASAPAVAEICRRLDGLPLAIELAAARVKLLPPDVLLSRLEDRLVVLTGGAHDLPPRHRTLRAAIEWSYALLPPNQQRVLRCLAVFAGGFDLTAAEAVAGTHAAWMLDCMQALLDNGLLSNELSPDGETRYRMLQTVREYAGELLAESEEAEPVRQRYTDYYLNPGPRRAGSITRLAPADHGNLRHALESVLADNLERSRDQEDRHQQAMTLDGLGGLAVVQGDVDVARAYYAASARIFEELGNSRGTGVALLHLGQTQALVGQRADARRHMEAATAQLTAARETALTCVALAALGQLVLEEGDLQRAADTFIEALHLAVKTRQPTAAIGALEGVAAVAVEHGRLETAARLLAAAARLRESAPTSRSPFRAEAAPSLGERLRVGLGDQQYAAEWSQGRAMSLEEAVELSVGLRTPDAGSGSPAAAPGPIGVEVLSPRERQVAALIAQGLTNRQIAEQLVITEWTADSHVRHILTKLKQRSRAQVAVWAAEHSLTISPT